MKKSVLGVAVAAAIWAVGSVASAAPIDIVARETSSTTWDVFAQTQPDVTLGQIALVTPGFDAMILNLEGGASISPPDSIRNPSNGNLTITGTYDFDSRLYTSLLAAGSPETHLVTLVGGDGPKAIISGDEAFGFTALDGPLDKALDYSLTLAYADGTSVTTLGTAAPPLPVVTPPPKPVLPAPIPGPSTPPVSGGPPASAPIPEPRSVVVFASGAIIVAWAIARSRARAA